jgi:conjugal transfer pilus assembly protein TraA
LRRAAATLLTRYWAVVYESVIFFSTGATRGRPHAPSVLPHETRGSVQAPAVARLVSRKPGDLNIETQPRPTVDSLATCAPPFKLGKPAMVDRPLHQGDMSMKTASFLARQKARIVAPDVATMLDYVVPFALLAAFGAEAAYAGTDTTFNTALTKFTNFLEGSGGKVITVLSLAGGVVGLASGRFSLAQIAVPVGVGVGVGTGVPIVTSTVTATI